MRPFGPAVLVVLLMTLALAPPAAAQSSVRIQATLTIDVQPDHAEQQTLAFTGLHRLTEYRDICLPVGATPSRVFDDVGDVPYTTKTEADRVSLTFRARGETLTIAMARAGPGEAHAPFYEADANFCVPEASRTTARIRVPEGHKVFFAGRGGTLDEAKREGALTRDGPLHFFYAYEAPLDPASDLVRVDAAPFHIVVPREREAQAREVAEVAAPALRAAAQEAGLRLPWDRLRVRYAPDVEFTWEAGHYGGHGLVTVREGSLTPDLREGYPYSPARVLVHESFHALSAPYGRGLVTDTLDWWLEGGARHAESHVDAILPNGTSHCEKTNREVRCWSFDDRIAMADVEQAYAVEFTFERRWTPSLEQSAEARSFYYQLSAFLVGAYVRTQGEEAYRVAWAEMAAAFERDGGCPCAAGWLEGVLLRAAGGDIEARDLYRPYGNLHDAQPIAFQARVEPLLKDERALQDELDRHSDSGFAGLGVPGPGIAVLALALAGAALAARRLAHRG